MQKLLLCLSFKEENRSIRQTLEFEKLGNQMNAVKKNELIERHMKKSKCRFDSEMLLVGILKSYAKGPERNQALNYFGFTK